MKTNQTFSEWQASVVLLYPEAKFLRKFHYGLPGNLWYAIDQEQKEVLGVYFLYQRFGEVYRKGLTRKFYPRWCREVRT